MAKVSNEARSAAADILEAIGLTATAACVREGNSDSDPTVQEVARFEAATIERVANPSPPSEPNDFRTIAARLVKWDKDYPVNGYAGLKELDAIIADASAALPIGAQERRERECALSPNGKHQVDTSMESGPNNCFHCEQPMGGRGGNSEDAHG